MSFVWLECKDCQLSPKLREEVPTDRNRQGLCHIERSEHPEVL